MSQVDLVPDGTGTILRESQRQRLEELAQRPRFDELNIIARPDGPLFAAARKAAFGSILGDDLPETQIRAVYRLIQHMARQILATPGVDPAHAEYAYQMAACMPPVRDITVGATKEPWPSIRMPDGKYQRKCRRPRLCPWCFYRQFVDLAWEMSPHWVVTGLEMVVEDRRFPPKEVRRAARRSLDWLGWNGIPWARVRMWPDFRPLEQDGAWRPTRLFLVMASKEAIDFRWDPEIDSRQRVIHPLPTDQFIIKHLTRLYRFDQYALPLVNHADAFARYIDETSGVVEFLNF